MFRPTVILLGALAAAGCSTHPLPENVTGLDTYAIVRKISCEARDSLKFQVEAAIRLDERASDDLKETWIDNLYYHIDRFPKLRLETRFEDKTRAIIDKYSRYLMYFDYTFTIYEDNNNSSEVNLISKLVGSEAGLNLKASNNRRRQNIRNFRVRKTFQELVAQDKCGQYSTLPDPLYPITGEIGLHEVIDTFLKLNEEGGLATDKSKNDVQLFADTLQFQTVNTGEAGPRLTLTPIGKILQVADAGMISSNTRSDQHQVLIGMALPSDNSKALPLIRSGNVRTSEAPLPIRDAIRSDTLDLFMNEQIRRNLILELGARRPAAISLF